jgi:hypothetical protein
VGGFGFASALSDSTRASSPKKRGRYEQDRNPLDGWSDSCGERSTSSRAEDPMISLPVRLGFPELWAAVCWLHVEIMGPTDVGAAASD